MIEKNKGAAIVVKEILVAESDGFGVIYGRSKL